MWRNSIKIYFIPIILLSSFILGSCVDEPNIAPVKRPFSVIRVANFSSNVAALTVTIDGASPVAGLSNLAVSSFTGYFDINSGTRKFLVKNSATGDTVFNKEVVIASYEALTIAFAGYYSTVKNDNNFGTIVYDEGSVTVSGAPNPGNSYIYIINTATGIPTVAAKKFSILTKRKLADETSYTNISYISSLDFNKSSQVADGRNPLNVIPNLPVGNYLFDIKTDAGVPVLVFPKDSTFNSAAGKKYFLFIYGRPDSIKVHSDVQDPQPVRSK